jgi:hypothetical protein
MGYDANRLNTGTLVLRVESGRLLTPASVAAEIVNFEMTPEGTLASVRGPIPALPSYGQTTFTYGRAHGVFHGLLMEGSRDVLLAHMGQTIWTFTGWSRTWAPLIGPTGSGAQIEVELVDSDQPQYPTQFEQTPNGIVIVPQNRARAYFYDGEVVLPLGYDRVPNPPHGYGPLTYSGASTISATPNYYGYSGTATWPLAINLGHPDFGYGEVGTVLPDTTGVIAGVIAHSTYQAAVQFIDYFGNLSPVSQRSNVVGINTEEVAKGDILDEEQYALLWTDIASGPDGTIGRILLHTKDMRGSGTVDLYEVPGNMMGGTSGSFATFPDNSTQFYHYNRPDSILITRPPEPVPVPTFKLCAMAFGRLWIAGVDGDPSVLIPSAVGQWGTFLKDNEYYPDPRGAEITGLCTIKEGLLVFTATSAFVFVSNEDGQSFKAMPLSATVGCVAPSSIVTMQDDSTIWLGRDGFYRFSADKGVVNISLDIEPLMRRINPGRAKQACASYDPRSREYRCWVPLDGGRLNDVCFVFDTLSEGWRRREGTEYPAAVHLARDHRSYTFMAGRVQPVAGAVTNGVWVMDHEGVNFEPAVRTAKLETSWIEAARSKDVKSGKVVYLWLREGQNAAATITVYRDWRMNTAAYTDTANAKLVDPEDVPPLWGTTAYGAGSKWIKRRPYWKKVSIFVPSCEVYKIVIESTAFIELLGISMDEQPHGGSGRIP